MHCFSLALFLILCIYGTHCHDDKTAKLVEAILKTKAFPKVNNTETAERVALYLQKHYDYLQTVDYKPQAPVNLAAFPCQLTGRSDPRPKNARRLKPADIDVVGAIGDSIAAGFGALSTSIFGVFTEYRGVSFAAGGEKDINTFLTIPNILRLYNPNLKGYAVGNGKQDSQNAVLNQAVSGATSYDLQSQISALQTRMKQDGISPTDWILITIFVGGNDLCAYCDDTTKYSAGAYANQVGNALDTLKAMFPNLFVNLVSPPNVTLLGEVSGGLCEFLHSFECGCATDRGTSLAHKEYTDALMSLVSQPKYNDKESFHVSLQPFLSELKLPLDSNGDPDKSYFAPDCFHFSGKAHYAAGVSLWNNMCETGVKLKSWFPGEPLECPEPYLA